MFCTSREREEKLQHVTIPDTPPKSHGQKRIRPSGVSERAQAYAEFAVERIRFSSIGEFLREKCEESVDIVEWQPSKDQMVRDIRRMFGRYWAAKRGRVAKDPEQPMIEQVWRLV